MKIPVPIRIALIPAFCVVALAMLAVAALVVLAFRIIKGAAESWLPDPCWHRGGPWLAPTAEEEADERMPKP